MVGVVAGRFAKQVCLRVGGDAGSPPNADPNLQNNTNTANTTLSVARQRCLLHGIVCCTRLSHCLSYLTLLELLMGLFARLQAGGCSCRRSSRTAWRSTNTIRMV